ncbi:MAG: aminoglycoside phosphotransferase family protein [Firmicutes bacterium]|nr:aminoglycoside phosphotransferase family protein [Bacillota bacterium]
MKGNSSSYGSNSLEQLLNWCTELIGPFRFLSDDMRIHGRSQVYEMETLSGAYYLKLYQESDGWHREVHGYEHWAHVFGENAPKLLGVYEGEPLAIIISRLPGRPMLEAQLSTEQEQDVWRAAGEALAKLHNLSTGVYFGPCNRDGSAADDDICLSDPIEYVSAAFRRLTTQAVQYGYLTYEEQRVIDNVKALLPSFAGECPVPCHRDYGPDNWLITDEGKWSGVIDFEFAYWDLRVADFSRYPHWEWMYRPDLLEAFFEGYGRPLTPAEEAQSLVLRTQYALAAVVWGRENSFFGFEKEGHEALRYLADLLL